MRKRRINPQYLRHITAQDVKDDEIAAIDFAESIKGFADEYLGGIMELTVDGTSAGTVDLKLSVASYLIRLLCECGDTDDIVRTRISFSDELTLKASYSAPLPTDNVAHIVNVARLAGFTVERDGYSLTFKARIRFASIMQIYAVSAQKFRDLLVLTYKM